MTMKRPLDVGLRPPTEITYNEIVTFWTRIRVRLWSSSFTVWLSPNKDLQIWTNDTMQRIALLWTTAGSCRC